MHPTDVNQAFTLSLYEQSVKIGNTGFWLTSNIGNDNISYPFWTSGEGSISLQRPLYINRDVSTSRAIPYLANAYLGGGYRVNSGIDPDGSFLSWVTPRILNGSPSGSFIAGIDFHLPVYPQAGVSVHARLPFESLKTKGVEPEKWGKYDLNPEVEYLDNTGANRELTSIVPVSKASGRFTLFYNWWLNPKNPENYLDLT